MNYCIYLEINREIYYKWRLTNQFSLKILVFNMKNVFFKYLKWIIIILNCIKKNIIRYLLSFSSVRRSLCTLIRTIHTSVEKERLTLTWRYNGKFSIKIVSNFKLIYYKLIISWNIANIFDIYALYFSHNLLNKSSLKTSHKLHKFDQARVQWILIKIHICFSVSEL